MKLPFLKNRKWPRIAPKMDEKLVSGDENDHLEDYSIGELMDAVEKKDIKAFRMAFEALLLNCFEDGDDE